MRKYGLSTIVSLFATLVAFIMVPTIASPNICPFDLPFDNPPETSLWIPIGGWIFDADQRQRNILINFDWDPTKWHPDANVQNAKELAPRWETCIWCGWNDMDLYEPDWISFEADWGNYWGSTLDFSGSPQGLVGIWNQAHSEFKITIYLNNFQTTKPVKHIWVEYEFYVSGPSSLYRDILPNPPAIVTDEAYSLQYLGTYYLGNLGEFRWYRQNIWKEITPSPTGEKITFTLYTDPLLPGTVLIDKIHIATESVDIYRMLGDVNDDGKVNAIDVSILLNSILGNITPPKTPKDCADMNSDGKVSAMDLSQLLNLILGNQHAGGVCDLPL